MSNLIQQYLRRRGVILLIAWSVFTAFSFVPVSIVTNLLSFQSSLLSWEIALSGGISLCIIFLLRWKENKSYIGMPARINEILSSPHFTRMKFEYQQDIILCHRIMNTWYLRILWWHGFELIHKRIDDAKWHVRQTESEQKEIDMRSPRCYHEYFILNNHSPKAR